MLWFLRSNGLEQWYDVLGAAVLRLADVLLSKGMEHPLFHLRRTQVCLSKNVSIYMILQLY